jgi:diguanylate cyclase (GGDEF)-like protein
VIGTLAVGGPAQRRFAPEDVTMLRVIGHQVGAAIDNARLHEEATRLAITDGLTGLYNRRHFYQVLEQELARAVRYKGQASLIILDIDDFKRFNDTYGHLPGDRLLQDAGHLLRGLSRKVDTVARYGGEEFVVLMPQTDKAGAIALAERILTAAPGEWGHGLAGGQQVTFSAGVATDPADATAPEELVHAADTALYQAKREGKNRVCAAGGGAG